MKTTIPSPDQMFDELLTDLEQLNEIEQSQVNYSRIFDQLVKELTDDQIAFIADDRKGFADARVVGKKYYLSKLTIYVYWIVLRAMSDPEKFKNFWHLKDNFKSLRPWDSGTGAPP